MKVREIILKYGTSEEMTTEARMMDSPETVYRFCKDKIANEVQEVFLVLIVNNKNRLLAYKEVSRGTVNETLIHPREVFMPAILAGAASIIIVHNHPSGEHFPASREDLVVTKRIYDAGEILGIELLDHVIVSMEGFNSAKENGWF